MGPKRTAFSCDHQSQLVTMQDNDIDDQVTRILGEVVQAL